MRLDEIVQRLDEYVGMFNKDGKLDADYMEFRLTCLNSREGAQAEATELLQRSGFTGNDSQLRAFVERVFAVDPKRIVQQWTR